MALDYEVPEDKRSLYWLGDQLIEWRNPVMVLVLIVTAVFAYWTFQLRLVTSFGDLVPQSHEFVKIHNKYSGTFGGANNIVVMYTVEDGTIFTKEHLTSIFKMTEGMDTVYGVNHNQIESIGHRTVRHLKVAAGGTLRAEPVMLRAPQGQDEVDETRRIVHNAENVYGLIVSLDDKAALDSRQLHRGPPRLPAHLRRRQQQGHRALRGSQRQDLRRRRAAALRLGLSSTPATSSSSSSSPTASSGCCAGCTSTIGAARSARR